MLTMLPNLVVDQTLQRLHLCMHLHTLLLPLLHLSLRPASSCAATAPVVCRTAPSTPTVPWPPRDLLAVALATSTTTCTTASSLRYDTCPGPPCLDWPYQPPLSPLAASSQPICRPCDDTTTCSFSSFACETLYTLTARANDDHGKNKNCSRSTQCRSQLECSCRCSCCAKSLIKSDQNPVHHRSSLSTRAASEPKIHCVYQST